MTDEEFADLQRQGDAHHAAACRNCGGIYKEKHGDLVWPGPERNCFAYDPAGAAAA